MSRGHMNVVWDWLNKVLPWVKNLFEVIPDTTEEKKANKPRKGGVATNRMRKEAESAMCEVLKEIIGSKHYKYGAVPESMQETTLDFAFTPDVTFNENTVWIQYDPEEITFFLVYPHRDWTKVYSKESARKYLNQSAWRVSCRHGQNIMSSNYVVDHLLNPGEENRELQVRALFKKAKVLNEDQNDEENREGKYHNYYSFLKFKAGIDYDHERTAPEKAFEAVVEKLRAETPNNIIIHNYGAYSAHDVYNNHFKVVANDPEDYNVTNPEYIADAKKGVIHLRVMMSCQMAYDIQTFGITKKIQEAIENPILDLYNPVDGRPYRTVSLEETEQISAYCKYCLGYFGFGKEN